MSRTIETINRASDWWVWNEPKWWRKLMKHRKRRASLKIALRQDPDEALYPLDKKPWRYYW